MQPQDDGSRNDEDDGLGHLRFDANQTIEVQFDQEGAEDPDPPVEPGGSPVLVPEVVPQVHAPERVVVEDASTDADPASVRVPDPLDPEPEPLFPTAAVPIPVPSLVGSIGPVPDVPGSAARPRQLYARRPSSDDEEDNEDDERDRRIRDLGADLNDLVAVHEQMLEAREADQRRTADLEEQIRNQNAILDGLKDWVQNGSVRADIEPFVHRRLDDVAPRDTCVTQPHSIPACVPGPSAKTRTPPEMEVEILDATPKKPKYRSGRRSTLSADEIAAIKVHQDLNWDDPYRNRPLFGSTYLDELYQTTRYGPPANVGDGVPAGVRAAVAQGRAELAAASPFPSAPAPKPVRYMIDGRVLSTRAIPVDAKSYTKPRLWDKTKRHLLDSKTLAHFEKLATGYVLTKNNKFQVISTKNDDSSVLEHVHNHKHQVRQFREHIELYDMADVCTIVIPKMGVLSPELKLDSDGKPVSYDLFTNYAQLHPAVVAQSNMWYNLWSEAPYIAQNMNYLYLLVKNNVDEKLWNKCLEDLEDYAPIQHGGPLMFLFAMKRIQNGSESAIENLKNRLKNMKISKFEGENVENAISFIKSAYQVLLSASTENRNYVPEDLPKTILKIFQTTSIKSFNEDFKLEYQMAQAKADKCNGVPEYPTIAELTTMASNKYQRLLADNLWNVPKKSAAFPAVDGALTQSNRNQKRKSHGSDEPRPKRRCFGCGREDHTLPECKNPGPQAEIDKRKKAYQEEAQALKKANRGKSGNTTTPDAPKSQGPTKDAKGRPMKLNKNGVYVVDQKRVQFAQDVDTITQAFNAISANTEPKQTGSGSDPNPTASSPTPDPAPSAPQASGFAAQREQATKAFARLRSLAPKM